MNKDLLGYHRTTAYLMSCPESAKCDSDRFDCTSQYFSVTMKSTSMSASARANPRRGLFCTWQCREMSNTSQARLSFSDVSESMSLGAREGPLRVKIVRFFLRELCSFINVRRAEIVQRQSPCPKDAHKKSKDGAVMARR